MRKYFVLFVVAVMHTFIVAAQDKSADMFVVSGQIGRAHV